jgi:integral membrane protein
MTIPDLRDSVGRVRAAGMVEGVSFLILLIFSALKRMEGFQEAGTAGVRMVGMLHGVLFLAFLLAIFQAWGNRALSGRQSLMAFIASLIPFGPFIIDRRLAESTKGRVVDSAD